MKSAARSLIAALGVLLALTAVWGWAHITGATALDAQLLGTLGVAAAALSRPLHSLLGDTMATLFQGVIAAAVSNANGGAKPVPPPAPTPKSPAPPSGSGGFVVLELEVLMALAVLAAGLSLAAIGAPRSVAIALFGASAATAIAFGIALLRRSSRSRSTGAILAVGFVLAAAAISACGTTYTGSKIVDTLDPYGTGGFKSAIAIDGKTKCTGRAPKGTLDVDVSVARRICDAFPKHCTWGD